MRKALLLMGFLFSGMVLFAAETFDSQVLKKEEQKVYGGGTLSTASMVYSIWVMNKEVSMKIDLPKKAFDLLKIGDVVRITYEKGLVVNEIKKIALVKVAPTKASDAEAPAADPAPQSGQPNGDGK